MKGVKPEMLRFLMFRNQERPRIHPNSVDAHLLIDRRYQLFGTFDVLKTSSSITMIGSTSICSKSLC